MTGKDCLVAISAPFVNLYKSVFSGFGCTHNFRGVGCSETMINLYSELKGVLRALKQSSSY